MAARSGFRHRSQADHVLHVRVREPDWLVTIACALAILAAAYVLVQLGVALEVILLALLGTCLLACGWSFFIGLRAYKHAQEALGKPIAEGKS